MLNNNCILLGDRTKMEIFKTNLFGISGLSLIFWVCVIALWHVYMFPKIFEKDSIQLQNNQASFPQADIENSTLLANGGLRPSNMVTSLINRSKYSRKSLVVADFSPIEEDYSVNRLYTSLLLSLGVMSFLFIGYGLHSVFS